MEISKIISLLENIGGTVGVGINIIDDHRLSVDGWEYLVVDEGERYDIFKEEQEALWNELGLDSFSTQFVKILLDKFINAEKLCYLESYEASEYYDEEKQEEYGNYLKYLFFEVDSQTATDVINRYDLLDFDGLCRELIEWDGYAPTLARYDGEELELYRGYFAYLVG